MHPSGPKGVVINLLTDAQDHLESAGIHVDVPPFFPSSCTTTTGALFSPRRDTPRPPAALPTASLRPSWERHRPSGEAPAQRHHPEDPSGQPPRSISLVCDDLHPAYLTQSQSGCPRTIPDLDPDLYISVISYHLFAMISTTQSPPMARLGCLSTIALVAPGSLELTAPGSRGTT